jgi:NAD(P)-dependent dehydrogenase (short-subunit alcohol dehydrogenase family)
MDLDLRGKTALVTGSTGGIGFEIARVLAREGAEVIICGRSKERLDRAAADIGNDTRNAPRTVLADPASAEGALTLAREAPRVDILVNNLGIYEAKDFGDIADEDWYRLFEANVMGGVRLARHYLPDMLAVDWGRIIFISSEASLLVPPDMIHYAVTKSAQLTIARGLAETTKGTRVTVNSVMPGPTRSEGIFDFLKSVASNPNASQQELEAEFFRVHRASSLIQRLIEPQEIANLVAFLASPLSAAINGAAIRSEGGLLQSAT